MDFSNWNLGSFSGERTKLKYIDYFPKFNDVKLHACLCKLTLYINLLAAIHHLNLWSKMSHDKIPRTPTRTNVWTCA